jgi:G3E family GTPase
VGRTSPFVSLEEDRRRDAGEQADRPAVPFIVLTGFLGAGKTTLLNRVLAAPQGKRVAVLVNDIGQINIDRQLIARDEGDLIELTGGCVCCEIDLQRDLFSGVDDLAVRAKPDVIVLETTGIADPRVLLAAFDEVEARRRRVVPSGVVCVVDAEVGTAGEARPEWAAQLASSDRVVLTKLERARDLPALHARLGVLAPDAERAAFPATEEGTHALVPFLLAPRKVSRSPAPMKHAHSQLSAYAIAESAPYLEAPLLALIHGLGDALVRLKGWARVVGMDGATRTVFLERAGLATTSTNAPPRDRSELVFIVEAGTLDEETLRRRLWACRAPSRGT